MTLSQDMRWMRQALQLAERGLGQCWPNPSVGCVLVQDGMLVSRAVTAPGGRPHAEAHALHQAGPHSGMTAYVTLEPCAHHGQTPPCAQTLIDAGIKRVVVAMQDPDPRVSGRGIAMLRKAGVEVTEGVLQEEAARLAQGFVLRVTQQRPLVALKIAASLDGRIALGNGQSQWITSPEARHHAHWLRSRYDAIVVGSGTALFDDPLLTCRLPGLEQRSPVRVILDRRLRLPVTHRLVQTARDVPVWLVTSAEKTAQAASFEALGVKVIPENGDWLKQLAAQGLTRLLVEGGATLATNLLREGRVDELWWYQAPRLLGGDALPAIGPLALETLDSAPALAHVESILRPGWALHHYRNL